MNRLLYFVALTLVLPAFCSCANEAGQVTASRLDPLVMSVTGDLDRYLDAGISPDGSPLSVEAETRMRGGAVILRNVLHTALRRDREPLPRFPTYSDEEPEEESEEDDRGTPPDSR